MHNDTIWNYLNFGSKFHTHPNSETGLIVYIMIALDFIIVYASILDSITYGLGYTIKIPKI